MRIPCIVIKNESQSNNIRINVTKNNYMKSSLIRINLGGGSHPD
jgi:hypothetical protein